MVILGQNALASKLVEILVNLATIMRDRLLHSDVTR